MIDVTSQLFESSILNALVTGIYVLDRDLNIRWINGKSSFWSEIPYFPRSETDSSCHSVLFQQNLPCDSCPTRRAFESGKVEHSEMVFENARNPLYLSLTATPMQYNEGEVSLVVQMVEDITEKKKIENEFAQINDFNTAIVENAPIAISTIDKNGVFTSINPAMAASIGLGADAKKKVIGFRWLENEYTIKSGLAEYIRRGLEGHPFNLKEFPFVTFRGDRSVFLDFQGVPMAHGTRRRPYAIGRRELCIPQQQ